jgi:hypothetical protein
MPKVDICALDKKMCLEFPTLHWALMFTNPLKSKEQALF